MLYELIVRIFGTGIAAVLSFYPFEIKLAQESVAVHSRLNQPVTREIQLLVVKGFEFSIEFETILLMNDQRAYSRKLIKRLSFDSVFHVNGEPIDTSEIQFYMGSADCYFSTLKQKDGDRMVVFSKAHILSDSSFTHASGLKTSVLWDYFVPRLKCRYIYSQGQFIQQ